MLRLHYFHQRPQVKMNYTLGQISINFHYHNICANRLLTFYKHRFLQDVIVTCAQSTFVKHIHLYKMHFPYNKSTNLLCNMLVSKVYSVQLITDALCYSSINKICLFLGYFQITYRHDLQQGATILENVQTCLSLCLSLEGQIYTSVRIYRCFYQY